ncbi:MAG: hypothetical protein PHT69_01130 [Bacteroidales bacterium]|nr:hypothetical protein [Bacteroidales bacterium]
MFKGIRKGKYGIFLVLLLIAFSACLKREEYPIVPHIEYVSFTKIANENGIDVKGQLMFSFTDGDGDIGLATGDTLPPYQRGGDYYYNFFIFYNEVQNGQIVRIELPQPFHVRLPVITPTGNNKAIKGEIEIELDIFNPVSLYDTILFDFYIVDRALNESNTVRTPQIVVKKTQ